MARKKSDMAKSNAAKLKSLKEFSADDVRHSFTQGSLYRLQLILVDAVYRALSIEDWQTVIKATTDEWKNYQSEVFDCDDFARCQAALVSLRYNINGIGQVYDTSGQHSYNVLLVVDDSGNLVTRVLEPQDAQILTADEVDTGHYKEASGFIII